MEETSLSRFFRPTYLVFLNTEKKHLGSCPFPVKSVLEDVLPHTETET